MQISSPSSAFTSEKTQRTTHFLRAQMEKAQSAVLKCQTPSFESLGSKASIFSATEAAASRNAAYLEGNQYVLKRLEHTGEVLDSLQSVAREALSSLAQYANDPNAQTISRTAKDLLERGRAFANEQFDGQYIFAGTATNSPPVKKDLTQPWNIDTENASAYYIGSPNPLVHTLDTYTTLPCSVTADSPAFEKLFRALGVLSSQNLTQEAQEKALRLLHESSEDLIAVTSEMAVLQKSLGERNTFLEAKGARYQEMLQLMKNPQSEAEAIVQLQEQQMMYETWLAALRTLRQISFLDYMQ